MTATSVHAVFSKATGSVGGVDVTGEPDVVHPSERWLFARGARVALFVFIAVEIAAFFLYVWVGRRRWFFHDEWTFLVNVDGGDLGSLFAPHNDHWTTLPKILYRVMFNVFGIDSYRPFQLITISLHLIAAALLRVIMRRAGVSPWIATIAATVFVLFGAGDHNILRAFQVTFVGALVFGLVQILLTDHDGPISWRDWLGVVVGLLTLMFSGIGIAMVAAVVVSVLIRRGWRAALLQLLPLAAAYAIWFMLQAADRYESQRAPLRDVWTFARTAFSATFEALGQNGVIGLLLALVLVAGTVVAWRDPLSRRTRRIAAMPFGLLVGAVAVAVLTAWSRASFGVEFARQSRYEHIIGALSLPALAVGADALSRRWRLLAPAVVVLLLVGIPGNLEITWNQTGPGRGDRNERALFKAFATIPAAADGEGWERPDPNSAAPVTLAWLRGEIEAGRLHPPEYVSPQVAEEAELRLSLQQVQRRRRLVGCRPVTERLRIRLEQGEWFTFTGTIRALKEGDRTPNPLQFDGGERGSALQAIRGPLELTIAARAAGPVPTVCSVQPA